MTSDFILHADQDFVLSPPKVQLPNPVLMEKPMSSVAKACAMENAKAEKAVLKANSSSKDQSKRLANEIMVDNDEVAGLAIRRIMTRAASVVLEEKWASAGEGGELDCLPCLWWVR